MDLGEEIAVELEKGKMLGIKLRRSAARPKDGTREVFFDFNGMPRAVTIEDRNATAGKVVRAKASADVPGEVGAPMPGVVLETRVAKGDNVTAGTPMVVLSAMKMETVVAAPVAGKVTEVNVQGGDDVQAGDLLVNID